MSRKVAEEREQRMAAAIAAEAAEVSPEDLDAQDEAAAAVASAPVGTAGAVSLTFEQLKELLSVNQASAITPQMVAEIAAEAAAKAKMPENRRPPLISDYNPLGERDHPRPKLKCHIYMGSAPVGSPRENTTLTRDEIEALNRMGPGFFRVRKMDGSNVVVEVRGQVNANRQVERLWIVPPEGDNDKNMYPPLVELATQLSNESNRVDPVIA
jgi:hypothetical protein